ncbi:hypothetical protein H4I96_10896 [Botrytis cinerea]
MFRTTPPSLFRQLPALLKFKLHQPLPLTQRESTQLLELLTTSFRQQLDSEHGPSHTSSNVEPTQSNKQYQNGRPRRLSDAGHKHTDRHIKSILTNPLFNQRTQQRGEPGSTQDPMDTFDRAVGRGMMTLNYAKAILIAKKKQLQSSHETLEERSKNLQFYSLNSCVQKAMKKYFWEWISKAIHSTNAAEFEFRGVAQLLSKIVTLTARLEASFNDSIAILLRITNMAKDLRFEKVHSLLTEPGQHVFHLIVESSRQVRAATSLEAFKIFQQILPNFSIHDVDLHTLDLYSPYHRSADYFLEFLRQQHSSKGSESEDLVRPFEKNEAKKMVSISLMAAKILLEQNRVNDATWVMEYLRTNYPKLLGIEADNQERKGEVDEASSIQILESFSLA